MIFELKEEELYRLANSMCTKENYEKASRMYQRLREQHPTDWKYANLLGYCLVYLGKYEEARVYFLEALEKDGLKVTIRNNIGWSYFEEGRYEEANEALAPFVEEYKDDASVQFNMGNILHSLKKYEKAMVHFHRVEELDPTFVDVHFSLGLEYYYLGKYAEAKHHFLLYDKEERQDDVLYFLSKCLLHLKEYRLHLSVAEKLLEKDEQDVEILIDRAVSYMYLGRRKAAREDIDVALTLYPFDEDVEAVDELWHRMGSEQ